MNNLQTKEPLIRTLTMDLPVSSNRVVNLLLLQRGQHLKPDFSNVTSWNVTDTIYVNKYGQVYKADFNKEDLELVKVKTSSNGYQTFTVNSTNGKHEVYLHRVIYSACHEVTIRKGQAVHHIDGNRTNNDLSNLGLETLSSNLSLFFKGATGENKEVAAAQECFMDSNEEQWKTLSEYRLQVSSYGRLKTLKGKIKEPTFNVKFPHNLIVGYTNCNGRHTSTSLSQLVAEAWLKTPKGKHKVLIKDRQKPMSELFKATNLFIVADKKGNGK